MKLPKGCDQQGRYMPGETVEPWGSDKQLGWVIPALVFGFAMFCVAIVVGVV